MADLSVPEKLKSIKDEDPEFSILSGRDVFGCVLENQTLI